MEDLWIWLIETILVSRCDIVLHMFGGFVLGVFVGVFCRNKEI